MDRLDIFLRDLHREAKHRGWMNMGKMSETWFMYAELKKMIQKVQRENPKRKGGNKEWYLTSSDVQRVNIEKEV